MKIQDIINASYTFIAVSNDNALKGIVRINSKHKLKGRVFSEIKGISVPVTINDKSNYDEDSLFFYGNSQNLNENCRRWKTITDFEDYLDEEYCKGMSSKEKIEKGRYKIPLELLNLSDKRIDLIEKNVKMLKDSYSNMVLVKKIIYDHEIRNLGTRLSIFPLEFRKEVMKNKEYYHYYVKKTTVKF